MDPWAIGCRCRKDVQRVLVGNKADSEDIVVPASRGQELAEKPMPQRFARGKELEKEACSRYGIPFFQTSAWFGENVNEVRGVLQLPQAARPS